VGAGILGLPFAFKQSGILLGGCFLVILAYLAHYCVLLLVDCKKHLEHKGVVRCRAPFPLLHAHLNQLDVLVNYRFSPTQLRSDAALELWQISQLYR
jgi:hypothetical protein